MVQVFIALAIVGTSLGAYVWWYMHESCDVSAVRSASDFLMIQLKRYDDVYMSAVSGTPTSLTYPVTVLQQTLVDTQQVTMPACMRTTKRELIGYMDTVIRAFQSYQTGQEDAVVRDLVSQSDQHYADFRRELKTVNECAPLCWSTFGE